MAILKVNQQVFRRAMRIAAHSGLIVAIALFGSWQTASFAQTIPDEDIPEVDPDRRDRTDPDVDDRIDPDTDPDVRDRTDPDADARDRDNPEISSSTRFFCQYTGGQYTVMYNPESRPNEAFPWAIPAEMGGGWTPELRCQEIARRLEDYRPDGLLELQTGTENGYNTVCATSEADSRCRIVFTVPSGQDPTDTRNAVFENLTIANSGETTQGVNTFAGSNSNDSLGQIVNLGKSIFGKRSQPISGTQFRAGMNLRPHLDPADGGTGQAFNRGVPISKQRNRGFNRQEKGLKLQPDQFR
ncbi:MAG: hypothetical protein HC851_16580 [Acaryochloris sp. RU_4_1]|nr:hypothetical protein [Acaryochloris sp. SU_5_25]NJM67164.1 hypothetical protein [Acaryochloris sp. RU_4_1]NJR55071.1 hypothetical protein [Acaryochloris sp. CRU_2_0]